jgi:hypothetical protein
MPSPGVRVRLRDGRTATVSKVTPDGSDDRVRFHDGSEAKIPAWDVDEILDEEPDQW